MFVDRGHSRQSTNKQITSATQCHTAVQLKSIRLFLVVRYAPGANMNLILRLVYYLQNYRPDHTKF